MPYEELEAEVLAACRSWDDELGDLLAMRFGDQPGRDLAERYSRLLPDYYKTAGSPRLAMRDIEMLERVRAGEPFAVGLQNEGPADMQEGASALTRLVLAAPGPKVPLGRVLPILEGLGLAVDEEHVTRLDAPDGAPDKDAAYLHDFGVLADGDLVDVDRVAGRLTEAVGAIYSGRAESDSLNRLVERAGLTWRDVTCCAPIVAIAGSSRPRSPSRTRTTSSSSTPRSRACWRSCSPPASGPRGRPARRMSGRSSASASTRSRASTRTGSCAASSR